MADLELERLEDEEVRRAHERARAEELRSLQNRKRFRGQDDGKERDDGNEMSRADRARLNRGGWEIGS